MIMDQCEEEEKYFDTYYSGTVVQQTGWVSASHNPTTILTLFAPVRGTGINQRIGDRTFIKKIHIKGTLNKPFGNIDVTRFQQWLTRIIIVLDESSNGAQATSQSIMDNSTTTAFLTHFLNLNSMYRFKILAEKIIDMSSFIIYAGGTVAYYNCTEDFEFCLKFEIPLEVRFRSDSGTISSCLDKSFHILVNTNYQTSEDQDLNITYNSRVYFTE